jgi:hypothetical protein
METEMRKIKAALCASRTINKQRRASCAINQSHASRAIKNALRYQSKPRFARNQKRASRNQSRAARVTKARFARQLIIQANIFSRFALNQYFALRALDQKPRYAR